MRPLGARGRAGEAHQVGGADAGGELGGGGVALLGRGGGKKGVHDVCVDVSGVSPIDELAHVNLGRMSVRRNPDRLQRYRGAWACGRECGFAGGDVRV